MNKLRYYISSFRLRTLPLSISGILLGTLLAAADGSFRGIPFCLAIATTLSLQILSNLANELGDLKKGTDNEQRLGPIRSIQSGALTIKEFQRVIFLFILLSIGFGTALVYTAFDSLFSTSGIIMLFLGAASVIAAIKYTVGKNAYGYRGLGDLFVFLFFGLLSTAGAYFLMTHTLTPSIFLPASAIGFLSVGVLNMNNIRDMANDKQYGKRTLPVMIGEEKAKTYHYFLILFAFVCMTVYAGLHPHGWGSLLYLLTILPLAWHLRYVYRHTGQALDTQLKVLSLTTSLFALLAGFGQFIG